MTFPVQGNFLRDLDDITQWDLNQQFVGEKLGSGVSRDVYACRMNPDLVVKIEKTEDGRMFSNFQEFDLWNEANSQHPEVAKWLAPVISLSTNGLVLVMKRTKPLKKMPKELPDFFNDIHDGNFGMLNGRVVCHDYAITKVLTKGLKRFRLVGQERWS